MDERHLREYEKEVGRKVTLSPSPIKLCGRCRSFKRYCTPAKRAWTLPSLSQGGIIIPTLVGSVTKKLEIVQYNEKFHVQQVDEKRDLAKVAQKVRHNVREILKNYSEAFSTSIGNVVDKHVTIVTDQMVTLVD